MTSASSPFARPDDPAGALASEWSRAVAALATADEVCLACHVRPDGDALGSMLAVAHALLARREQRTGHGRSQRIVASFGDGSLRVPDNQAEVAIVFKQDDDDAWQVSARSKGNVDVGRVCLELGGGGHAAAGFTSPWPVADALQRLRELLCAEPGGRGVRRAALTGPIRPGHPRPDGGAAAPGGQ